MKQTDWKIIYTSYEGISKSAIHLLSKEAGALLIREPNVYRMSGATPSSMTIWTSFPAVTPTIAPCLLIWNTVGDGLASVPSM